MSSVFEHFSIKMCGVNHLQSVELICMLSSWLLVIHWYSWPIVLEAPLTNGSISELHAIYVDSTSTLLLTVFGWNCGCVILYVLLNLCGLSLVCACVCMVSVPMSTEPDLLSRPLCGLVVGFTRPW